MWQIYRFASPCCELPKDWKGKDVYFHVGSATSNLTLWVNGKPVLIKGVNRHEWRWRKPTLM
ncbi:glycoside hydrolase family 2 TIM barrel-domain containing protein [Segatella copri]|uniref:glycoside hydrolase family 2 TIM barrel-domain containing protein n=1 Tax=Segatella copri TaxID=165179 RepID=UPI003F7253F4